MKNTGKVREICQSEKVGTMVVNNTHVRTLLFAGSFTAHRFAAKYGNDYIDESARSSEVIMP